MQADLWTVDFDENQISQVIDNVVINAKHAMPGGGRLFIKAENYSIIDESHPVLEKGDYIRVSFHDEGKGIPKDQIEKVFDPFFTTKQSGSGLGLATSYSIIKKHNGHIEIDSIDVRFHFFTGCEEEAGK